MRKEERTKAIASLMFLKENREHLVKARMCMDGQKQRGDWTKQDTSSPTMSTEAVFITAVVPVLKYQVLSSDKDITMIPKGRPAELVQVVSNLYRKYKSVDRKGTAIIFVKMQKSIYRLLRSALLLYKKLVANRGSIKFKFDPYDPCVANKEVNGTQMAVCLHKEDLKVSHVDPTENTRFGDWLSETYGVTVAAHQGAVHDHQGMIFDFSVKGKVMINMIKYIKNIITNFPEEIVAIRMSPAADHLFTVRD